MALSAIDNEAFNDPATVGLNSTEIVQLAAAARDVPQVLADLRNEVALVPVKLTVPSVTVVVPVFFIVTALAAVATPTLVEAKASDVGETVTVGAAVAVPVKATS